MLIDQPDGDPIQVAFDTLGRIPVSQGLLDPRHRAELEARNHPHRHPFVALEEAWRDAQRSGTDAVEDLRGNFEVLENRYGKTLPPPEAQDLRARYLALLAMAHTRRLRDERFQAATPSSELALAEQAIQQARLTLADGTGRPTVRAAVLEAEALVAVVKQNGRACALLAEAAELLRGVEPPDWRAEILYWRGKLMAAGPLRDMGQAVAVLREALATLDGVESPTEPVLRLAVIHHLTLAETEDQLTGDDAGVRVSAAARLRAAEPHYAWFSTTIMRGQRAVMEGRILLLSGDLRGAQAAFRVANAFFAARAATFEAARLLSDVVLCCRRGKIPAGVGPTFYRGTWQFPAQREFFDRVVNVLVSRLIWRLPPDCHARVMPFVAEVRAVDPCAGSESTPEEDRARRWQWERFRILVRRKSRQTEAETTAARPPGQGPGSPERDECR